MAAIKNPKELPQPQRVMYYLVQEECNNYIGGWENTLQDFPEDSDEYKEAWKVLHQDHETLVNDILFEVRTSFEWKHNEHLHFVPLEWVKERIDRRLKKWGY